MNLTMRGFESKVITEDKISLDVPLDTSRPHVPLTAFHWGRVILDKGHRIRNAGKSALEAICLIKTEKRVVSMRTPFNNEYTDVASLFRFLQVKPWNNYQLFKDYFIRRKGGKARRIPPCCLPETLF